MDKEHVKGHPEFVITPEKGFFSVSGRSYPENAVQVFQEFMDSFNTYCLNPLPSTTLELSLEYCNSSTISILGSIFNKLEDFRKAKQVEVIVKWYCDEEDEDIIQVGEDLEASFDVPFQIIKT